MNQKSKEIISKLLLYHKACCRAMGYVDLRWDKERKQIYAVSCPSARTSEQVDNVQFKPKLGYYGLILQVDSYLEKLLPEEREAIFYAYICKFMNKAGHIEYTRIARKMNTDAKTVRKLIKSAIRKMTRE